jgi:autotransporter adhesin
MSDVQTKSFLQSPLRLSPDPAIGRLLRRRTVRYGSALVLGCGLFAAAQPAQAQAAPNLVSACSGVSLPPSVVTGLLAPVFGGIVSPIQGTVNPILGAVGGILGVPNLNINVGTLLNNAAAGQPITLQVLNANGTVVGPADRCDLIADSVGLNTPAGIAIGGNRISGLGANGLDATAGELNSIAFGNSAATDATSAGAIAIGANAAVGPNAAGTIAFGDGATATGANSVALGAGSLAARGPLTRYTAFGTTTPQNSAGEVSVGAVGAERQITNVAAGTAGTDAVNMSQLQGVAALIPAATANSVQYDGTDKTIVTLGGAGGTTVTNVKAGDLSATSTDAVNGSQLYATNQNVANNTAAITNLTTNISNGAIGPVQYSNPADPTTPNGGTATNDLTLVGAAAGAVGLHNVAAGSLAAGSTDAVNGGQIHDLALTTANAITYDTDVAGNRTNTVTLVGGNTAAPVTITNVAPGSVSSTSTDVVNGSQLYATNQTVVTAQTTADTALTLGQNSVQYDNSGKTDVTLGTGGSGGPVSIHNVAAGLSPTDAVNVAQLSSGLSNTLTQANAYTDQRFASLNFDLKRARRQADAGTSAALAAAGLPQAYEAGKGMIAMSVGAYGSQTGFALGGSKAMSDGHTVVKLSASYDTSHRAGGTAGLGYQF